MKRMCIPGPVGALGTTARCGRQAMSVHAAAAEEIDRGLRGTRIRVAVLVLAAWVGFGALQISVGAALARPGTTVWSRELLVDLTMALYWTAVSGPIAAWHRRLRVT